MCDKCDMQVSECVWPLTMAACSTGVCLLSCLSVFPSFTHTPTVLRRTLVPTQHLVHKLQSTHDKDNSQGFLSPLTVCEGVLILCCVDMCLFSQFETQETKTPRRFV